MFSFISRDVQDKIEILDRLLTDADRSIDCASLEQLIKYERANGRLSVSTPPSGTRTFTRLHRAIQFVHQFVEQLATADPNCATESLAKSAYNDTLARYHSWFVQKGVGIALKLMPNRARLLENVLGEERSRQMQPEEINQHFKRMSQLSRDAFERCELVLVREQVQNLP
jgi:hypothetical protein